MVFFSAIWDKFADLKFIGRPHIETSTVKRNWSYYSLLFIALITVVISACSTKKDSAINREYHNITSYFNGYFNATENVRLGLKKVQGAYKEDYDKILPIFIIGDTASARSAYPEMEKAIEKCEKVISRHTITNDANKGKKRPKLNKWIDDNYMTLGQAHYYKRNYFKSEELFNYVSRKYKEPDVQLYAAAWIARAAMEREEYSKALQALSRVEPNAEDDPAIKANYYLVFTDLYLRQAKYRDASEKLELAIKNIEKKKDRARPHFILAQIYSKLRESSNAQREYEAALRSHPNYELAFYAKINKAIAFSRLSGRPDEILKELQDMLKDEKNKEYRDQIYFAIGDIYQEAQNRPEAIVNFESSLRVTAAENKKQKSKTYLRLADLYFADRYYTNAQQYYDSTLTTIDQESERYDEVKARAESLGELVGYINTIELNDSMVVICGLSPAEQEKKLGEVVKALELKAQEQKAKDEAAAEAAVANAADPGISGTFWAYNANIKKKGYDAFKDYWGDRPLKDNWRLSAKLSQSFGTPDESIVMDSTATSGGGKGGNGKDGEDDRYKVPDVQELKATLPCNDASKMASARYAVAEAYYKSGLIYKEKLDDERNAVSAWQDLTTNIDSSSFHPLAYYQLFRNYLNKEAAKGGRKDGFCETCNSEYWAAIIKQKYPGSEWARLVDNPEYLDQAEVKSKEENDAYEEAYRMYANRRYYEAITAANNVINNQPNNGLLCRWRLLRAICTGYTDAAVGLKEAYFRELNEVKSKCPSSPEAQRADELIRAGNQESVGGQMNGGKGPEEGSTNGKGGEEVVNNPSTNEGESGQGQNTNGTNNTSAPADSTVAVKESPYKVDMAAEHYCAVLLPLQGTDVNKAKADVSDFNASFYGSLALKTTNNLLGQQYHIVLVKPFKALGDCKEYLASFKANKDALGNINSGNPIMFVISKPNYIALFKTKDVQGYVDFYQANYKN